MNTCIILLSHANTQEKEEILNQSILSLKELNLPIVLVSHCPISERNQKLCDYSLYEKNNIIFNETDFFNYELPITEANFNAQFFFGGISTRTYLQKETYNGSVINLITNGINIANLLGFEYGLFWEFDFILQEKSKNSIISILHKMEINNHDCFFIPCQISGINTTYSIPQVFPIKKMLDYNSKIILTAEDFINVTKFQICEEWLFNFYKTLTNPLSIPFEEYKIFFPDMKDNLSSSGLDNPLFWGVNSGVFIDKNDKTNWIYSMFNETSFTIKYSCKIFYDGNQVNVHESEIHPEAWFYDFISKDITNEIINSNKFLTVIEEISYDNINKIYEYKVNKDNLDSISKGKVFFHL